MRLPFPSLCFALALFACELDRSAFEAPLAIEGPVVTGDALHWLDGERARLITLEPDAEAPVACRQTLPHARGLVADGSGLRYLGKEDRAFLAHLQGTQETRIALPVLFDEIHLSPTGKEALLLFDPEAPPLPGEPAVRNIARFAVAHLEKGTTELVPIETGGVARDVVFSDDGSLAALLLDRGILVLDPARPALRRLAHLELATGVSLRPIEARFAPGGSHLVVRAHGVDDLLVLDVRKGGDRLDLVLNFLAPPTGGRLRDFRIVDGERVAALFGSRIASLDLGGDSTRSRTRPLMGLGKEIVTLEGGKLLVTGPGEAGDSFVAVWDPETEDLDQSRVEGSMYEVRATESRIFVTHTTGPVAFLSVIEVGMRDGELRLQQQSLPLTGAPSALALVDGGVLLGSAQGDIVLIEGDDVAIEGLHLDDAVRELGTVGRFLWARHPSSLGDLSLVPAKELSRDAARRFEGLFLAGLMECE